MPETLTPLSNLLPLMLPYATDMPEPVAEAQLRLAANEFCKETLCWREVVDVTLVDAPIAVTITGGTLVKIEKAMFDDATELKPEQFQNIGLDKWDDTDASGEPSHIFQLNDGTVTVYPFKAGTITLSGFFAPQIVPDTSDIPGQNKIPLFLANSNGMDIVHGALSRAFAIPKQSWTSPDQAAYHGSLFEQAKARRHGQRLRGQQRARVRVKSHFM